MPYVDRARRQVLDAGHPPATSGDLAYVLTKELLSYLEHHGEQFQTHSEILGALEATKLEWYRRRLAPYEDEKCEVNGDVYDPLGSGPK